MIYLAKKDNTGVCHCKCAETLASIPGQLNCPWCGCGWLFTCTHCRKAFTFAKAIEVPGTLNEFVRADLTRLADAPPDKRSVADALRFMEPFLHDAVLGKTYVYFDGLLIPADAGGVTGRGIHSEHDLSVVPQVEALKDSTIIRDLLRNTRYWHETAKIPKRKGA